MKARDKATDETRSGNGLSRRRFITSSALVGGCAAFGQQLPGVLASLVEGSQSAVGAYKLALPENVLYSTCLQCHVDCQIKAKLWDGTLAKLTGNPYSPQNYLPHLPFDTDLERGAKTDGKLCAKGQSGIQTYYDPYRIRKVLKREGPRGSNQWKSIPFGQFVDEVTRGGQLFSDIGDNSHYPGFEEIWAVRDPDLAKELAADAHSFAHGEMSLDEFHTRHEDHLDQLIDPQHPDLGPKNNGFIFNAGRIEHGRKELMQWFITKSFGSVNSFDHTTICEQSHHIAYSEMTGHDTHHMKPDLSNSRFILFWGTGAFTANFGLTPMAEKVTKNQVERGLKTAVIDPRLSNDAAKADWWLPIKPGTDGALAMAMIRWIIENERYDRRYLTNANRAAATEDGEPSWTNSSYLVKIVDGHPLGLLRANEAGVGSKGQFVVSRRGRLLAVDSEDSTRAVEGDLFVDRTVRGIRVKSAFQLLREEAERLSWEDCEEITGIDPKLVAEVAAELTAHGKKAAVELYRGPVQHTDGYYAGCSIITLNLLVGNPGWKGGLSKGGSHWHEFGGKPGNVYDFSHPRALTPFGPPITREKSRYEDSSLFRENGYPASRPWFPFSNNVYQEIIPSFADGYPYTGKIFFLHKGTPALSIPGGHKLIEILADPDRIPLFVACDIVIGETSMYADYILPDLTYLERWGTPHTTPDVPTMVSKIRQPVAKPLTEEVDVDGERMPISLEAFLIALGKKLHLPGFGKDALGKGFHLDRPEDWFLKTVANVALEGDAVPDASAEEMEVFRQARRHLPPSVFDEAKWRRAVRPREWPKVVYVLNRGGRFAPPETAYDGPYMKKGKMTKMFHLFVERVAESRNSMSGEYFSGIPVYRGQFDITGQPLESDPQYPFTLITYKEPFGGHSRTISNYWTNIALGNENQVLISRRDAQARGLSDGQRVRLVSDSNPDGVVDLKDGRELEIAGPLRTVEGLAPGVVAVSWHYGHWAYGSNDVVIDGSRVHGDRRRAAGLCPNMVMALDPALGNVCLTDPIGASSSFFDTRVQLVAV